MDISGRKTREPTVRSIGMDELLSGYSSTRGRPDSSSRLSHNARYGERPYSREYSSNYTRGAEAPSRHDHGIILRLDADGKEREHRKVSNRENFVDTGIQPRSMHMERDDEVYGYDSSAENTVQYLNEGDPMPSKPRPLSDKRFSRTVDTVIPTVPRLHVPPINTHDVSFGSRDSRDTDQGCYSSPPSSRSEKMQRTLKNISLNEREPFPDVRARIAQQREKEQQVKGAGSTHTRRLSPPANSNNNALTESDSASHLVKSSHAEDDTVQLNSSPESVIVRPIKRKVATAPDVFSKATKMAAKQPPKNKQSAVTGKAEGSRSKSADWKKTTPMPKWVDKTPGKQRSASASCNDERAAVKRPESIRPDSWRQGMAVVRRELRQKRGSSTSKPGNEDLKRPNSARSDKSSSSGASSHKLPAVAQDVLQALGGDSDQEQADGAPGSSSKPASQITSRTKRSKVKIADPERAEPVNKQRHYDTQSVQEFMAKKKKEKRLQDLEERKRRSAAEKERQDKLKSLQDRSRKVVSKAGAVRAPQVGGAPVRQAGNATFTATGTAPVPPPQPIKPLERVWAPPVIDSASYTVPTPSGREASRPVEDVRQSECSRLSEESDEDGEGDTTLTEAELQPETPTKQTSRSGSRVSTPRSKPASPLSARTRAVEEEIEQLVQAAKQRNQAARQMQAQAMPLKMMDQLTSTDTTTDTYNPPNIQANAKSARIASLAQTTAHLMSKMNLLKADLENTAMSRSNSRGAMSNYSHWLNTSFSPRDRGSSSRGQRLPYSMESVGDLRGDEVDSTTTEILTDDEDHTHSTVSDSPKTHSTVTTDSELSDNESELSSLDLRIREALSRPTKFSSSAVRSQAVEPKDIVKPVARVARSLAYGANEKGDGHSVINTYLRKLQADRESLSLGGPGRNSASTCPPVPSSAVTASSITTQTSTALATTGIQTDIPQTTHSDSMASRLTDAVYRAPREPATSAPMLSSAYVTSEPSRISSASNVPPVIRQSTGQSAHSHPLPSQSAVSHLFLSQSAQSRPATTQSTHDYPADSQSKHSRPANNQSPPVYSARAQASTSTQAPRISPAGLDLALSAGISLLEGMNQQQVQLSDVERTRFSTLAQQETVALAQILKGSKERQEQHLMNLRQKIKQDEIETQQKLAQFRKDAELANQKREEAEKRGDIEANKLSKDATRRVLEAQTESTKAFTEASKLLAERRERLNDSESQLVHSARSVVDTLKVQSDVVTASLTSLVDQQRHQNLEMLRIARQEPQGPRVEPQGPRIADAKSPVADRRQTKSPRPKSRTRSPRDCRSPRNAKATRSSTRSPQDSALTTRDVSRSPRGSKSPRPRKLRSPKDRSFQDIVERSDLSTTSTRRSDDTIRTDSVASYSDDFGSPSDKSSHSKSADNSQSPGDRYSPVNTESSVRSKPVTTGSRTQSSITEKIPADDGKRSSDSSIKTGSDVDSLNSSTKKDSIRTDFSEDSSKELSAHVSNSRSRVDDSSTQRSRSSIRTEDHVDSKRRTSDSSSASNGGDTSLHKVVLGAVKEVFKDASPAQLQSDPAFYDRLKSVLYTLKDGGPAPTALSTPFKTSPLSSPSKPPMVAPLSPRFDRRLTMRRPAGQRSAKRTNFLADSESDESHSLLETASDTDQECQLSALQHQLDEAKRRHAMMKKARQKYEFQKKQDTYKKQIEYYEDDMVRMKKEMDDLAAMQSHTSGGSNAAVPSALNVSVRPQIKQPRAPSSSGSDNGKQRHSSGASDADQSTPQPSVIQKPLVGKSIGQFGAGRPSYERQRSDSGRSVESENENRQREKTPENQLEDISFTSKPSSSKLQPPLKSPPKRELSSDVKTTPRTESEADYTYSNGFDDVTDKQHSSASDSIAESIAESVDYSLQSSKGSDSSLSQASDLMNLGESPNKDSSFMDGLLGDSATLKESEEPSLMNLKQDDSVFTEEIQSTPAGQEDADIKSRSRSASDASTRTLTEARAGSRSATPTWSKSDRSRSASPSQSSRSRSRSRSSRSMSRSLSRSRSRTRSSYSSRSHTSRSRSRSRSQSRSISEVLSVASASPQAAELSDDEKPLLDLDLSHDPQQKIDVKEEDEEKPLLDLNAAVDLTESRKGPLPDTQPDTQTDTQTLVESAASEKEELAADKEKDRESVDSYHSDFVESYHSDFSSDHDKSGEKSSDQSADRSQSKSSDHSTDGTRSSTSTAESVPEEPYKTLEDSDQSIDDHTESDQLKLDIKSPDQALEKLKLDVKSPDQIVDQLKLDDQSPDQKNSQSEADVKAESIIEELLESAYEENFGEAQQQKSQLSLRDELEAALADGDRSITPSPRQPATNIQSESATESATESAADGQDVAALQPGERLAESTPRQSDKEAEEREQRDFEELEKLLTEPSTSDSADQSESSRISLGSKSPDFLEFSYKSHDQLQQGFPTKDTTGEDKSEEESELDKVISSAAAAVEAFANGLDTDELNHTESIGDVGVSVIEETTPRSLMSLESSADDLLDEEPTTPKIKSPRAEVIDVEETTPRVLSPTSDTAGEVEADFSEKSIREADESQLDAACSQLLTKSLDTVLELWKEKRQSMSLDNAAESLATTVQATPPLSLVSASDQMDGEKLSLKLPTADELRLLTKQEVTSPTKKEVKSPTRKKVRSPTKPEVTSPTKQEVTSPTKQEVTSLDTSTRGSTGELIQKEADKENRTPDGSTSPSSTPSPPASSSPTSFGLLGVLPPLVIKPVKPAPSSKSPPESLSPSSSEESISPQRSPTKTTAAVVEEARHEHWVQLDKDIDSVFNVNDGDWFDEEFSLGAVSKPVSVIPKKEILNRVAIPQPIFIVPHQETEVKALADNALDVFWQARRCGESWDDLGPTQEYLDTGDQLELEATANIAFRHLVFDLMRDMLNDIFQNEDSDDPSTNQTQASAARGVLGRHYKHRQPPTTLDEVREIIHKQIYPAVTGKMVHPTKSARVMSVARNKRRDKLDAILTQELREEELSWLDYTQDEQAVRDCLVEDVFKVLIEDSVSAILGAYNTKHNIQPITEL